MPWTVDWRVLVNGQDMSGEMARFLTSISVTDQAGTESDRCSLAFDDRDAQLRLPGDRSAVTVYLQGVQVFTGIVDSARSSGSRGSGRAINVTAKGYDVKGKAKEPQSFHTDDSSLKEFLGRAAEVAGFSLKVDDDLGAIKRDYWAADGESFVHLGERLAREFHATFKLRGTEAVFVPRGRDPGLPVITGTVGRAFNGNVISWDIAPLTGRRQFTRAEVRWFDRESASFKTREVAFSTDRNLPDSANKIRTTAADEAQAGDVGEARKSEAEREGGEGSVDLDLTVEAQAEAQFILTGARPGVDGSYRIVSVTHTANRSSGATTRLQLKQPSGGAGADSR